jgi:hypothetical protein
MKSTMHGSCHCGAVRFRCGFDPSSSTSRCNCSICSKTRLWKTEPMTREDFEVLQGASELIEYRFASHRVAHMFCRRCGVKVYGHGGADSFPTEFYVVNIACLENLSDEYLASLPVVYQDGRHDTWQVSPAVIAHL